MKKVRRIALISALAAGAIIILPRTMPIVLAFPAAALLDPTVTGISERLKLRRGIVSVPVCAAFLGSIMCGLIIILYRGISLGVTALKKAPELIQPLISGIEERVYSLMIASPPEARGHIAQMIDAVSDAAADIPEKAAEKLADIMTRAVSNTPKALLGAAAFAIGLFFISAAFPDIKAFFLRQIPEERRERVRDIKSCVTGALSRWARSELIMCGITFCELSAGLIILRAKNALLIAFLTAIIDMLPVFGAGIVLLPWACVMLIKGEYVFAAGLSALYAVVTVVRGVTEPKIIGRGSGVPPAAMLAAMYFGSRTAGVPGMVLCPIGVIVLHDLNDSGYIRLWRKNESEIP